MLLSLEKAEEIFEIKKPYSTSEIGVVFRKLAAKRHPDKGGSADSFKELVAARDVLKKFLDNKEVKPQNASAPPVKRGKDVIVVVKSSPHAVFFKMKSSFKYSRRVCCTACNGSGDTSGVVTVCHSCMGTGTENRRYASLVKGRSNGVCDECHGIGLSVSCPCSNCSGTGSILVSESAVINSSIKGTSVKGAGDYCWSGTHGNLIIRWDTQGEYNSQISGEWLRLHVDCTPARYVLGGAVPSGIEQIPLIEFPAGQDTVVVNTKFGPVQAVRKVVPPDLSDPEVLNLYRKLFKIEK